ncbi:MAG TPA: hypothetical protein ENJ00_02760 [Phycisphaerales bacterium]|nr:hypothetical protein [Phycisphaerales bacterium]
MGDTNTFERLVAAEIAGELTDPERAELDRLCSEHAGLARRRAHIGELFAAARTDDTEEAPGSAILRAYQIVVRERSASRESRPRSIVRIVFDSLLAAPALRGSSGDRRHLLLQSDDMAADVFIDVDESGRTMSVLFEEPETDPESVCCVVQGRRLPFEQRDQQWIGPVGAGAARIEVRFGDRVIESEPFEVV